MSTNINSNLNNNLNNKFSNVMSNNNSFSNKGGVTKSKFNFKDLLKKKKSNNFDNSQWFVDFKFKNLFSWAAFFYDLSEY